MPYSSEAAQTTWFEGITVSCQQDTRRKWLHSLHNLQVYNAVSPQIKATFSDTQILFEWIRLPFQPQDINDKTHHILTDIRGIEYFQGIVNIGRNLVRSVSFICYFAFTTQPGPTPLMGHSVPHSHELRAQHRRENRHDWNQNQILFNLYVHRKGSWLVQKSKSAMIGFLYPQSFN